MDQTIANAQAQGDFDRYAVDHRALLFGSRLGPVGQVNRGGRRAAEAYAASERQMIEAQNEQLVEELAQKVDALKATTLEIGRSAAESNKMLGDIGLQLGKAERMLRWTTARAGEMAKQALSPRSLHVVRILLFFLLLVAVMRSLGSATPVGSTPISFLAPGSATEPTDGSLPFLSSSSRMPDGF